MNETTFLSNYNSNDYEKPSITSDVLTFAINDKEEKFKLQTLLIKRSEHPFKDKWSLPGGFMNITETLEETASRVIYEKVGLSSSYLEQLFTFSDVDRDPRMRIISTTYLNLINKKDTLIASGSQWFDLDFQIIEVNEEGDTIYKVTAQGKNETLKAVCKLTTIIAPNRLEKAKQIITVLESDFAFDHAKMIFLGYLRILNKLNYTNIAFHFMEEIFTIPALQKVYECILQKDLFKTSFRNQIKHMIEDTGEKTKGDGFVKPAKLYRYKGGNNNDFA